jgi:hypothetical protein
MIREASGLFIVGQLHPKVEVPRPVEAYKQEHSANRLYAHLGRLVNQALTASDPSARPLITLAAMRSVAPELREGEVRARLTELCQPLGGASASGEQSWVPRSQVSVQPELAIRDRCSPEQVCLYEAARLYELRLDAMGLRLRELRTKDAVPVHNAALKVPGSLKPAARFVDLQLQLAPWNSSANYHLAANNQTVQLKLGGAGNPLARAHGLSYLRAPTRIEQRVTGIKTLRTTLQEQGIGDRPASITGTEKDLRKLHMDELRRLCLYFGQGNVDEAEVYSMKRWPLVQKLRMIATKRVEAVGVANAHPLLVQWARDDRVNRQGAFA